MSDPLNQDDIPTIGSMPALEAAAKLREIGEDAVADALEAAHRPKGTTGPLSARKDETFAAAPDWLPFLEKPWLYTAHAFGFLAAPQPTAGGPIQIQPASRTAPDLSLRGSRVNIALGRLRVANYPGGGTHQILFDFSAQNQVPGGSAEHLHFTSTPRAYEGQEAAVLNFPIFVGLNVGAQGVALKCFTVAIKNSDDEEFLGFLESDVFRTGLKLATCAQPAIALLSPLALGLAKGMAVRIGNMKVHEFQLGLDFSGSPIGAALALGSYVVVQIPDKLRVVWDWDEWVFNPSSGQIVSRADLGMLCPYNYVVITVSRYVDE